MNGIEGIGRILLGMGLLLISLGLVLTYGSRLLPIGRLPGDILVRRGNFTFYLPIVTTLIVSLLLSFFLNLFLRR